MSDLSFFNHIGLEHKLFKVDLISGGGNMAKWKCIVCGYIYDEETGDPDSGINPGTKFEEIPDDWVCPLCGAPKDMFERIED